MGAWAVYLQLQKRGEAKRDDIAQVEVARLKAMSEREARLFQHQEDMAQATLAEIARLRALALQIEERDISQRVLVEDLSKRLMVAEHENERLKMERSAIFQEVATLRMELKNGLDE
jgi:cell division protein FtsB